MFLGTHTPRLDDKGRLILPAKFRDDLAGGVVITKGQERCLYVFPAPEFRRLAEQLQAQPVTHKAARAYGRVFFASAHDELPDKQGRVTIPAAFTVFPGETYLAPHTWVERTFANLIYYHKVDKGGHFAGWEQPQLMAEELRAAFKQLR